METKSEFKLSGNFHLLLMEDDRNEALLFQRALHKLGLAGRHTCVQDGQEGIEYLQGAGTYRDRLRFPFPTMVFLDLKMPRKSGFDVLAWMHANPVCKVVPTIVFSSSHQVEDIRYAYDLHAQAYFQKPFEPNQLLETVRTILNFWAMALSPIGPRLTQAGAEQPSMSMRHRI